MLNYSDYTDNNSDDVSLLKNFLNEDETALSSKVNDTPLGNLSPYFNTNKIINKGSNTENKLNHIISLLEEKQDEKTETVFEELILYLFLGFIVIYIIDSFVRVGKYVR